MLCEDLGIAEILDLLPRRLNTRYAKDAMCELTSYAWIPLLLAQGALRSRITPLIDPILSPSPPRMV
jgi:hypothetical protein